MLSENNNLNKVLKIYILKQIFNKENRTWDKFVDVINNNFKNLLPNLRQFLNDKVQNEQEDSSSQSYLLNCFLPKMINS